MPGEIYYLMVENGVHCCWLSGMSDHSAATSWGLQNGPEFNATEVCCGSYKNAGNLGWRGGRPFLDPPLTQAHVMRRTSVHVVEYWNANVFFSLCVVSIILSCIIVTSIIVVVVIVFSLYHTHARTHTHTHWCRCLFDGHIQSHCTTFKVVKCGTTCQAQFEAVGEDAIPSSRILGLEVHKP